LYRAPGSREWADKEWTALLSEPYPVVFLAGPIPSWLQELLQKREIGILTAADKIAENIGKIPQAHVGLLRGTQDLKESYRVIQRLIEYRLRANTVSGEEQMFLRRLLSTDVFLSRPRLSFIPPIPLPQDLTWRPAAYILNRISNNVDEPVLQSPDFRGIDNSMIFQMVNVSRAACGVLGLLENGHELPDSVSSKERELIERAYAELLIEKDDKKRADSFFRLGDAVVKSRHLTICLGVPAGRTDILKTEVPSSLTVGPEFKKHKKLFARAISDYMRSETRRHFDDPEKQSVYDEAQATIVGAHRLMCTQVAYLSIGLGAAPLLVPELGGRLYSAVNNFYSTLDARSKKTTQVFQKLEIDLASALPKDLLERLDQQARTVIIYGDLPFEWTLLPSGWPICLTKPVCRVPVAATRAWSNLATLSKEGAEIATDKTDSVLVLDLIGTSDPIKPSSELFRTASDNLQQRYTYKSCSTLEEIHELLSANTFDIVVLDAHGKYIRTKDELVLFLRDSPATLDEFLPNSKVPPIWILSACDTALVGSVRGSLTRALFDHGALSVVGTLHKIAADAASLFVGKILTEIFSPLIPSQFDNFLEAFFNAQLTTAVLYDPIFPLMRKCRSDPTKMRRLARVFEAYLPEMSKPVEPKEFRIKAAVLLNELLQKNQLREMYEQIQSSGLIVPETLLYSVFGLPNAVRLTSPKR